MIVYSVSWDTILNDVVQ